MIGAPDLLTSGIGTVRLFFGNGTPGKPIKPRQIQLNYTPLARLGMVNSLGFFAQVFGFSPTGRADFKLQLEVKPLQNLFEGSGLTVTPVWLDTNQGGTAFYLSHTGQSFGNQFHWRVRFKFSPVTNSFNPPYSRWYHMPWNGWNEADLRSQYINIYLPLVKK